MALLNLGILAHIDAGKTSLTERLLYRRVFLRSRSRWLSTTRTRAGPAGTRRARRPMSSPHRSPPGRDAGPEAFVRDAGPEA